jgi:hypothetical protein
MTVRLAHRLLRHRGDVARFRATIAELLEAHEADRVRRHHPRSSWPISTFRANALGHGAHRS